jgi:hypothetical protein
VGQPTAAVLDLAMLHRLKVSIADEWAETDDLPMVSDPVAELGGRLLIKYIRPADMVRYSTLSGITDFPGPHYLTPTGLPQAEVEAALNLPPLDTPAGALLLLPEAVIGLRGPRRIAGGQTIEYVCDSFPLAAIAAPRWSVRL